MGMLRIDHRTFSPLHHGIGRDSDDEKTEDSFTTYLFAAIDCDRIGGRLCDSGSTEKE